MEELFGGLSIGPQMGLCFFLMVITMGIVNGIKRYLCETSWKWTAKIPSYAWWTISIIIPVTVCVLLNWDFIDKIAGEPIEGISGKLASVASGFIVGIAGQTTYGAKKAAKSLVVAKGGETTREFTPGGPNDRAISQPGNVPTQSGNVTGANGTTGEAMPTGTPPPDAGSIPAASTEPLIAPEPINTIDSVPGEQYVAPKPTNPVESTSRLAEESTTPPSATIYQQVRLTPNSPYVVLSEDGMLYRVHNGKLQHLPAGWHS